MALTGAAQDDAVMAEINITPFTDVLLVLLIIFMILAALITPPGFQKQLPNKSNPNSVNNDDKRKTIEVDVNERGTIFIDGKKSTVATIYTDMSDVEHRRGPLHVSIIADAKAPYGLIIRILDAAKLAGLDDVGFVTS
ncbi:MAG: biopolymer transporter ExbD [Candidatus Eremiobacteraeota bacterium]|nr:biopolymer transporter ExbD [Candidatus Eremiobacteraeota bacterium]MBV8355676.1 biopolymer transporter ExbD [Candidatus Eremiobacteraeota bacterium]